MELCKPVHGSANFQILGEIPGYSRGQGTKNDRRNTGTTGCARLHKSFSSVQGGDECQHKRRIELIGGNEIIQLGELGLFMAN